MGGLPAQEQAKVKKANETIEKITRREPLEAPNPAIVPDPDAEAKAAEEAAVRAEEEEKARVEAEAKVKEGAEAHATPETISKTEYEELKHKLSVLQGKFDKEVPYYAEQNRFLLETIQRYETEAARREQAGKERKPIPKLEEDPVFKSLQETDPEMAKALSLTHERTLEAAKEVLREFKEGIDADNQRDRNSRLEEKSAKFNGELADAGYPNINAVYRDPDFQVFLYKEEPSSGLQYGALIERAFAKLDSGRVVKFLDTFYGKKTTSDTQRTKGIDLTKIDPDKLKNKMGAPRAGGTGSETPPGPGDVQKDKNKAVHDLVAIRESKIRKRYPGTDSDFTKEEERLLKIITGSG